MPQILPDCMMPDGAEPCLAYQELEAQYERLQEQVMQTIKIHCGNCRTQETWEATTRIRDAVEALFALAS